MTTPLVILGAGGFGREVFDVIDAYNDHAAMADKGFEVIGFLDDGDPDPATLEPYGVGVIGGIQHLEELPSDVQYLIGIGSPQARETLDGYAMAARRTSPVLVHPSVHVGRAVTFGPGTIVCPGVSITNNIRIGRHVHLNLNATVGHDATLGNYVTVSPLVAISGYVDIGDRAMLGTGATLNPGIKIGPDAVIGSGAAVLKDVEPGVTAVGVPAKPRG